MPADHTPTDDTVLRQPAAPISPQEIAGSASIEIFQRFEALTFHGDGRQTAREVLGIVERAIKSAAIPAGCGIGNQQSSEDYQRVEGGRSFEGNQPPALLPHPDDEWTIDALHGHMEHLFGEEDEFSKASADAIAWCVERIEALTAGCDEAKSAVAVLVRIAEAFGCHPDCTDQEIGDLVIKRAEELKAGALAELAAENARLTRERDEMARRARMSADMIAACNQDTIMQDAAADEMSAQIAALKAEVERLNTSMEAARALVDRGAVRAWNDTHYRTEPMSADRQRVIETHDMFRQALVLLGADCCRLEADHAAAKEGAR
ncbi:hypothetical protein [Azospirillum sp. TSA6c]|uniref:hypothetical protein n=1 Tax=Azospirillum sp. TSA6c TaxID=709813 RepID=UPI001304D3ED|nr:hypothetical protein [Azospirillum sp. TSA6c]